MYILAIETTGAYASVAIADGEGKVLSKIQGNDRFSHLQNLTPQIQHVMTECGIDSVDSIGAIAVSQGPGSFTGIRIGVSTGRALAQVKNITCVPVPTLDALAMRMGAEDGICCPILDARRSQIYAGAYKIVDGYPETIVPAGAYGLDDFLGLIEGLGKAYFLGDGVDAYGDKIKEIRSEAVAFAQEQDRYQDSETVAKLGSKLFSEGKGCSYEKLKPEYMRLAEAERKLKENRKG